MDNSFFLFMLLTQCSCISLPHELHYFSYPFYLCTKWIELYEFWNPITTSKFTPCYIPFLLVVSAVICHFYFHHIFSRSDLTVKGAKILTGNHCHVTDCHSSKIVSPEGHTHISGQKGIGKNRKVFSLSLINIIYSKVGRFFSSSSVWNESVQTRELSDRWCWSQEMIKEAWLLTKMTIFDRSAIIRSTLIHFLNIWLHFFPPNSWNFTGTSFPRTWFAQ